MSETAEKWFSSVEQTLAAGEQLAKSKEEFNSACDHIVHLLRDASYLLAYGSHATSAFISITALEETAKVHIGMYRQSAVPIKRSKDPLYRHYQKHLLALAPTIAMASRLQAAIGEERMYNLIELGRNGGLVSLREASLYIDQAAGLLTIPKNAITPSLSRELLLLAVEAFDDALVGYTNYTFGLGDQTDEIFHRWADT